MKNIYVSIFFSVQKYTVSEVIRVKYVLFSYSKNETVIFRFKIVIFSFLKLSY